MKKKNVRSLRCAAAFLFVACFVYIAALPATSAWFYVQYDGVKKDFIFGDLDVVQTYTSTETIELYAATKLEDTGEYLFDDVLQIVQIDAANEGTLPARVYFSIDEGTGNPAGLRYYFFEDGDAENEMLQAGPVKRKISAQNLIIPGNNAATNAALALYNFGTGTGNSQGRYISIAPGVTKTLKIAFWADYNAVGLPSTLEDTDNVAAHYVYNAVKITLHAAQDTDGAFVRN